MGWSGYRPGDQADDLVLGRGRDVTDAGDAAQPHDLDPVGDVEDEVHVVADADDGGAPVAQLTDEPGGMGGFADAKGCRRLVEQDDPGAGPHRAGDRDDLALAAGQHPDLGLDRGHGDLVLLEEGPRLALHRLAVDEPAASRELAEEHVGGDVEHLDQGQILEDGSHASAPGVGGTAERDAVAGDPDLTVVLVVDAADDLDERGLAGAVVAEDGQHLPGVGGQVDAGESGEVAEPLGDAAQLKVGGAGARSGHRVLFQDSSFASARTVSRLPLVTKVVPVSVVGRHLLALAHRDEQVDGLLGHVAEVLTAGAVDRPAADAVNDLRGEVVHHAEHAGRPCPSP